MVIVDCYNRQMMKLHTFAFWEAPLAGLFKHLLGTEGVDCVIKNELLQGAVGELPFADCSPELWLLDDETYPRAKRLLDGWLTPPENTGEQWFCPGCGEEVEAHFEVCWKCGRERSR